MGRYVIPADLRITPVGKVDADVRRQFDYEEDDVILTRRGSRAMSKIVSADAAALLSKFENPLTLAEGVRKFSLDRGSQPEMVLASSFPILQRLVNNRFLVPEGSNDESAITASLEPGDIFSVYRIQRCVQLLQDTEIFLAEMPDGTHVALKLGRVGCDAQTERSLAREAELLERLRGGVAPRLVAAGTVADRAFVAMEWIAGTPIDHEASQVRLRGDGRALGALVVRVAQAYADLHSVGFVHGDVHTGNLIVEAGDRVRLIDFGLARDVSAKGPMPPRGGVGPFYEPEYAAAYLRGEALPPACFASEQYALAALTYLLLTGHSYTQFSAEKKVLFRQILEESPLPFVSWGIAAWPEVENVLRRGLSKGPELRYPSTDAFVGALCEAATTHRALETTSGAAAVLPRTASGVLGLPEPTPRSINSMLASAPFGSVTFGGAGLAYAWYRLACLHDDAHALANADAWATAVRANCGSPVAFRSTELGIDQKSVGDVSPYHNSSGLCLVEAIVAAARGDFVSARSASDAYLSCARGDWPDPDLTIGWSGVLLGISRLLEVLPDDSLLDLGALRTAGDGILNRVWASTHLDRENPQDSRPRYLGIAHGWAGILYAALQWTVHARREPAGLRDRLDVLAGLAEPAGIGLRWGRKHRRTAGSPHEYLAGWCHGSAGHALLWTKAYQIYGESRYLELATRAAQHAWDADEPAADLCCGFVGRAYAQLSIYRATGDGVWRDRAAVLSGKASASMIGTSREYSLYKGALGAALLAAEIEVPKCSCFPLFESEPV